MYCNWKNAYQFIGYSGLLVAYDLATAWPEETLILQGSVVLVNMYLQNCYVPG